jgi:quercetin dioxygenase-like cupin family protein
MILHKDKDVKDIQIDMEGTEGVVKKILIGVEDGSLDIIMRLFRVEPGGHTPRHTHPYPHIVKWISGKGIIVDDMGGENELEVGMSAFIPGNEEHQFRNPYDEDCSFLCIIPNPEKME